MHYISIDESINTIMVTGPADKVALAKKTIEGLDKPDPDNPNQQKIPNGPPILKEYYVQNGNAAALATALQTRYKDASGVTIQPAGNSTLIVYAYPSDQIEISQIIFGDDSKPKVEFVDCGSQDCLKVADQLAAMFGDQTKSNLYVGADSDRNAVILRGPPELVLQAKQIVTDFVGGVGGLDSGNARVITLPNGGASALADMLQRELPNLGNRNPVEIYAPGGSSTVKPKVRQMEKPKPDKSDKPDGDRSSRMYVDPTTHTVSYRDDLPPAPTAPPVRITAMGNKLYIESDDKKALKMAQDLIQFYLRGGTDADFEVIPLKNANAIDAAKVLDEVFNGKPQQNQRAAAVAVSTQAIPSAVAAAAVSCRRRRRHARRTFVSSPTRRPTRCWSRPARSTCCGSSDCWTAVHRQQRQRFPNGVPKTVDPSATVRVGQRRCFDSPERLP